MQSFRPWPQMSIPRDHLRAFEAAAKPLQRAALKEPLEAMSKINPALIAPAFAQEAKHDGKE